MNRFPFSLPRNHIHGLLQIFGIYFAFNVGSPLRRGFTARVVTAPNGNIMRARVSSNSRGKFTGTVRARTGADILFAPAA